MMGRIIAALLLSFILIIGTVSCQQEEQPIPYTVEEFDKLPELIKTHLWENRFHESNNVFSLGEKVYIAVNMGVKPTGGYEIAIEKVVQIMDDIPRILVDLEYINPSPQQIVERKVTYPMTVISILASHVKDNAQFKFLVDDRLVEEINEKTVLSS